MFNIGDNVRITNVDYLIQFMDISIGDTGVILENCGMNSPGETEYYDIKLSNGETLYISMRQKWRRSNV